MNLTDIFSFNKSTPAAAKLPSPEGTPTPAPGGAPAANSLPGTGEKPGAGTNIDPNAKPPGSEASPLADFQKMWENDPNVENAAMFQPLNADPSKINEAAKKVNFSANINPELARKALSGDLAAFSQVINEVGQNVFAVATQANSFLVDRQTSSVVDHVTKQLPGQLKRHSASESLLATNPKLADPAVQPLIKLIQGQLANQFPDATGSQLAAYAQKYLAGVLGTVTPAEANADAGDAGTPTTGLRAQQARQAKNQFDWGTWANDNAAE